MSGKDGINWKELWVLGKAPCRREDRVRGKLILVRMGNATAVAYANHGAGRPPPKWPRWLVASKNWSYRAGQQLAPCALQARAIRSPMRRPASRSGQVAETHSHIVSCGGATVFHRLRRNGRPLRIFPRLGNALMWSNFDADGNLDQRTRHAGEPVLCDNQKIGVNAWFLDSPDEGRPRSRKRKTPRH